MHAVGPCSALEEFEQAAAAVHGEGVKLRLQPRPRGGALLQGGYLLCERARRAHSSEAGGLICELTAPCILGDSVTHCEKRTLMGMPVPLLDRTRTAISASACWILYREGGRVAIWDSCKDVHSRRHLAQRWAAPWHRVPVRACCQIHFTPQRSSNGPAVATLCISSYPPSARTLTCVMPQSRMHACAPVAVRATCASSGAHVEELPRSGTCRHDDVVPFMVLEVVSVPCPRFTRNDVPCMW